MCYSGIAGMQMNETSMFSVLIIHIQACIYATAEPDYQAKPTNLACKSNALETEAKFVLYFIPSSKNKFKVQSPLHINLSAGLL